MTMRGKISLSLAVAVILFSSYAAYAVLNMGGKTIFAGTVIEVLEPGPATQIQDIITNITDASASNPYLIQLGPGVYDLGTVGIVMKQWVSIKGSSQEVTKITGAVSKFGTTTSVVVLGANNTDLTDLSIENTGGSDYSVAIRNEGSSPRIERVTATASGGVNNYGILNMDGSSPIMTHVTAIASGGTESYGVSNIASAPILTYVVARALDGLLNRGMSNDDYSSPTLVYVAASASGGNNNIGIYNKYYSSPQLLEVTASASPGVAVSVGMYNAIATPFVQNSIFNGSPGLRLDVNARDARIINSMIIGGIADFAEGQQCRGVYDANLADVTC